MTIKFYDSMTGSGGTTFATHDPDTPALGDYVDFNSGTHLASFELTGSGTATSTSALTRFVYSGATIAYWTGDEVYMDVELPVDGDEVGFTFLLDSRSSGYFGGGDSSWYEVYVNTDAGGTYVGHHGWKWPDGTIDYNTSDLYVPSWSANTPGRLGVTFTTQTSFAIWHEPWGGGTRTAITTWNVTYNYFDAFHKRLGLRVNGGGTPVFDNLTVQDTAPPATPSAAFANLLG